MTITAEEARKAKLDLGHGLEQKVRELNKLQAIRDDISTFLRWHEDFEKRAG